MFWYVIILFIVLCKVIYLIYYTVIITEVISISFYYVI